MQLQLLWMPTKNSNNRSTKNNVRAATSTRVCSSMVLGVPLCCHSGASPEIVHELLYGGCGSPWLLVCDNADEVVQLRDDACTTMQSEVCNFTTTRVRLFRRCGLLVTRYASSF